MRIVFYMEIWFSYGEREHALGFARQARQAGHEAHFVVEPRVAPHVRGAGFEATPFERPEEGVAVVRELDPDLVVGCEIFNLKPASVRGLEALGRPLATMDGTSLGVEINADPFRTPGLGRSVTLPGRYWSFRPCPVNDVASATESVFPWRLFPDAARAAKDRAVYADLGLEPEVRTVLLPLAPWATQGAKFAGLARYHDRLLERIGQGLEAAGEPIQLLVVAKEGSGAARRGRLAIQVTDLLPYDVYDHVLRSCDLVISDNVIQTSLSKALVMGTPHLVIQNTGRLASHSATGRGGLLSPELPYPCNIFPVRQLFPAEREYAGIVEVAEFGDAAEIGETLLAILRHGHADAGRLVRRRDYVERLASLPLAGEILARVLGPASR
jgi:hypothetical protein